MIPTSSLSINKIEAISSLLSRLIAFRLPERFKLYSDNSDFFTIPFLVKNIIFFSAFLLLNEEIATILSPPERPNRDSIAILSPTGRAAAG